MGQSNTNLKCIENQDKTPENVYYDPPKAVFVLIDPTVKLTDTIKLSLRSSLRFVAARWKLIRGGIFKVFHATSEGGPKLVCVYDSTEGSSCFGSGLDFDKMYESAEKGFRGIQSVPLYDACEELIKYASQKEFLGYRRVVDIFTNGIDGDGTKNKSKCSVDDLLYSVNHVPIPKWFHTHIYTATPKTPGELFYGLREAAFMDNFLMQFHSMDEDNVPKPALLKTLRPSNKYQHGLTLLINNRFLNSKKENFRRYGADKDTEEVRVKFRELTGNDVIVYEDVKTKDDLKTVLDEFVQKVEEESPDYLVVIVSSHGKYLRIMLEENEEAVDYHMHLVQPLKPSRSKEFLRVPQIFIIQACQKGAGAKSKSKPNVEQQLAKDEVIEETPEISEAEDVLDDDGNLQADGQGVSIGNGFRHSYFIGNATLPHTECYRDKEAGSFFLQAICRLFHKGPKLEDLMKLVDNEVTEMCKSYSKEPGGEIEQQVPISKTADFPQDFCFSVRDTETEE